MTKLLHKPLKAFALYALLILLISIPAYVFVIDYIWTSELDENNWLTLQHTKQKLQSREFTRAEIKIINQIWGELQSGVSITKAKDKVAFRDSIYETLRPNKFESEDDEERFRGLKSFIEINGESYIINIETNLEETDETFAAVSVVTLIFFMVLIGGFIVLNRRIASKSWQPFYQTLSSLKSFELSKDSFINLSDSNIEEFHEMNTSLRQLVKNNVDTYRLQKAFTENASHELQTPIALLKSKMDLLIQQKDVSPEISEILSGIEAPLARLSRINKNLLVLAKVENHQYSDIEEVDIKKYLQSSIQLFEDYLYDKQLQLSNNVNESLVIHANSFLMETLIHNLLSNAIRHTPKSGKIEISHKRKTIQIKNTGYECLDHGRLFERFSTSTKNKVSSGLGLAIIKEIIKKYGWQINYEFQSGYHVFAVRFSSR